MADLQRKDSPRTPDSPAFGPADQRDVWTAFGTAARAVEPVAMGMTRIGLRLNSLAGLRAKAYADIPATLQACRSPMDLFQAQLRFWTEARAQYAETTAAVLQAWQAALPGPEAFAVDLLGAQNGPDRATGRDYMAISETATGTATAAKAETDRPTLDRRAA